MLLFKFEGQYVNNHIVLNIDMLHIFFCDVGANRGTLLEQLWRWVLPKETVNKTFPYNII